MDRIKVKKMKKCKEKNNKSICRSNLLSMSFTRSHYIAVWEATVKYI